MCACATVLATLLTLPAAASALTVSGFAYADEATPTPAVWSQCNGSTNNVSLSFNGGAKISTTCNASTGAFSFTTAFGVADAHIAVFLDPVAPGSRGVTYTRNLDTSSNISGLLVTLDRVRVRSESTTSVTTRGINLFDSSQDTDIPASSDGINLTLAAGTELHVDASKLFLPGGDVTAPAAHLEGTWIGWPLQRLRLTGSGTGTDCTDLATMRPLCVSGAGKLEAWPNHIMSFTGTSDLLLEATNYGRLEVAPSTSGWPTVVPAGSLSASTLTLGDGTNPVTLDMGAGTPTINVWGDLAVASGATLSSATASTLHVGGSFTGAGLVDFSGVGSLVEHQPNGLVEPFGTTAGGPVWNIDQLKVDDNAPAVWGTAGGATYNATGANQDRGEAIVRAPDGSFYTAGRIGTNGGDFAVRKYTANGALDASWAGGMVSWNSAGTQADYANSLVIDELGNVYAGGISDDLGNSNWIVRKYTPAGALDTTWAAAGNITFDNGAATTDRVYNMALDADRNLYIVGTSYTAGTGQDLRIEKHLPSGALDTTWGTAGSITYTTAGGNADLYAGIVVWPDRSIAVCGQQQTGGLDWTIRKYTPAGALDGAFGTAGSIVYNSAGTQNDICTNLTLARDGSFYATGYIGTNATDSAIRKYSSTGVLDATFGTGGMFVYNSGGAAQQDVFYRAVVDQHDNIVVTGYQQTNGFDWTLGRLTPAGAWDTTFGNGTGYIVYDSAGAGSTDAPRGIALDPAGNITGVGYIAANGNDWAVRRWDAAGNAADGTAGFAATSRLTAGSAMLALEDLITGAAGDLATTTFDIETNDRVVDVDDAVTINTKGGLSTSSTSAFTVGGNFTRDGTFTPNTGTVTFDDATKPSTILSTGATSFYGLAVTTPAKVMYFDNVDQTNVTGPLTITGTGCGIAGRVQLRSDVPGQQFELNPTGAKSVVSADIMDSRAIAAATATSSFSSGNNTNWTITSCPPTATSMAQFRANGTTPVTWGSWTSDGAATNVILSFQVADGDGNETLTPWVEVRPMGTPFSIACGTSSAGVTFSGTAVAAPTASQNYTATVAVTGLTNGTQYHWRACAKDSSGVPGAWIDTTRSVDFGVTNGPVASLLTPTDGAWVTSRTPSLVTRYEDPQNDQGTVTYELCSTNAASPWSANCGASYQTGTSKPDLMSGTNGTWAPLTALTEGGTYYWRVKATDVTASTGPFSVAYMFRVDSIAPTVPGNPRSVRRGLGTIEIAWDASTDSGSGGIVYDVETSLDGATWQLTCDDTTSLTCIRNGLGGAQKLFFRIRAIDAAGNVSGWAYVDDSTQTAYYLRTSVASGLLGNAPNRRATVPPVGLGNLTTTVAHGGGAAGWYLFRPGQSNNVSSGATEPSGDPSFGGSIASPGPYSTTGAGWIVDDYAGKSVAAGPVQVVVDMLSSKGAGVGYLSCRVWRIATSGGTTITSATFLGKQTLATDAVNGKASVQTCDVSGLPSTYTFGANEALYVELWVQIASGGPSSSTLSITAEDGSSWIAAGTPGTPPNVPTLVSPTSGQTTSATPTLTATYSHPASTSGTLEFQVATTNLFGTILETGTSSTVASGGNGSYGVQGALTPGTTYWYRARGEDSYGRQSAWSAPLSFVIDVGPNTPSNTAPANGSSFATTTPTLTSSAFSDPTGGDSHAATQWQVRTATGSYASPIADYTTSTSLTSWTMAPPLGPGGYAWHVRYRDSYGQWSAWSAEWTFTVTGPAVTMSIDSATVAFGTALTGTDAVGTTTLTIATANATGYTLTATDESDTNGMSCACGGGVVDWTGTNATPTVWAAGLTGGFGITIRDATGGRMAKWGAGTGTAATDYVNNKYAGLKQGTSTTLHSRATSTAGDTVLATYRENILATTPAGSYSGVVTYTAVANP